MHLLRYRDEKYLMKKILFLKYSRSCYQFQGIYLNQMYLVYKNYMLGIYWT